MFCQDWGGLIGLRLVAESPERFDRVCVANTGMPVGEGATDAFLMWRDFATTTPDFDAGGIVQMATAAMRDPLVGIRIRRAWANTPNSASANRGPRYR